MTGVTNPIPPQDLSGIVGRRFIYTYANGRQNEHLDEMRACRDEAPTYPRRGGVDRCQAGAHGVHREVGGPGGNCFRATGSIQ